MTYTLFRKGTFLNRTLLDNSINIYSNKISFGNEIASSFGKNNLIQIWIDTDNNRACFKPASDSKSSYKIYKNASSIAIGFSNRVLKRGKYTAVKNKDGFYEISKCLSAIGSPDGIFTSRKKLAEDEISINRTSVSFSKYISELWTGYACVEFIDKDDGTTALKPTNNRIDGYKMQVKNNQPLYISNSHFAFRYEAKIYKVTIGKDKSLIVNFDKIKK